ncbi:hypothetical protein GH714_014977 [Hevea brasiliensis]|uniref:Uncharacterized protein n=1 Tax=Hevea brasiliensis TaxID=3981 RepID=A0A6A6LGS8_HEVBR|nr:hypothetical protein GH714_014977 [Hevea brasiliensis]
MSLSSHDFGSCFHTLEGRAMEDGIPKFLKNSIILQTFGVKYDHPCQDVENVVIPPYVSPESVRLTLQKAPLNGRRDIWVFFRGKMEVHPKNEGEDGDMEEIQRRPEVLLAETQICRLPVRDSTVGVLFMSIGVGPMESKTGRIRSVGLRAGNNSRWYPVAFPHRCSLAGDIPHGCGKGRGKAGEDS